MDNDHPEPGHTNDTDTQARAEYGSKEILPGLFLKLTPCLIFFLFSMFHSVTFYPRKTGYLEMY